MSGFAWFSLGAEDPAATRGFYSDLLGWHVTGDGMVVADERPWASIDGDGPGRPGWVPFVQVDDVDAATERARELGAEILREKTRGPAGEYTTIADPSGAAVALWQPA